MASTSQIALRSARDRVIDLLGIGETYPLQDLAVTQDLKVAFGATAKVTIDSGQTDVNYTLCDNMKNPIGSATAGTGGATVLVTPPMSDDETFYIQAAKITTFGSHIDRQDFLNQTAEIRVGVDDGLNAYIDAPLLDPNKDNPQSSDPRIVNYGTTVAVNVDSSQEGVDYRLVVVNGNNETVVSQKDVRGNLRTITIASVPMQEDVVLRVRATKHFDPSEHRPDDSALLTVNMPLMVRARTDLAVSAKPSTVPFGKDTAILISGTQASASYAVYTHTLSDDDFVYGQKPNPSLITINADIAVITPPWSPAPFTVPQGYSKVGDYLAGTGGDIQVPVTGLSEDVMVIVEARKLHGDAKVPSSMRLQQPALALVQPDPAPALVVELSVNNNAITGPMLVTKGQLGVFYFFRVGDKGPELLPPAYFHKHDADDASLNKGVSAMCMGIDWVVARDPQTPPPDRVHTLPPPPLLDIGPQALGITLFARGMKARSAVDVPITPTAAVPVLPVIKLDQDTVAHGSPAKIVVTTSVKGETYAPFLPDGTAVAASQDGNGSDLTFLSAPLQQDTTFLVRVTQPGAPGIAVTRTVSLTAKVQ